MGIHEAITYDEHDKVVEQVGCLARYAHIPKEGESIIDVRNRCVEFMKMLYGTSPPSVYNVPRILVVAHGFVVAQLIGLIYEETRCPGMLVDEVENLYTKKNDGMKLLTTMPNTGITKVEVEVYDTSLRLKSARCDIYKSNKHLNS